MWISPVGILYLSPPYVRVENSCCVLGEELLPGCVLWTYRGMFHLQHDASGKDQTVSPGLGIVQRAAHSTTVCQIWRHLAFC